jgi:hypothetical protein
MEVKHRGTEFAEDFIPLSLRQRLGFQAANQSGDMLAFLP